MDAYVQIISRKGHKMGKFRWHLALDCRAVCVILAHITLILLLASRASGASLALQVSTEVAPEGGWA